MQLPGSRRRARALVLRLAAALAFACAALPGSASLPPTELRAAEEARRLAVSGDLEQAQARWGAVLARFQPAHAVRIATPCAGLREALVARRDLAPLFVRSVGGGCHEVLWGHFATEDLARQAAGRIPARFLEGAPEIVALTGDLAAPPAPPPVREPAVREPAVREPAVREPEPPSRVDPPPVIPDPVGTPEPEPAPVTTPVPDPTPEDEPELEPEAPAPIAEAPVPPIAVEPPATSAPTGTETAASLFQKGNAAYAEGDLDGAVSAFDASLALEPDNPRALNNLGATWLLKGDPARAASLARRALEIDPTYGRASLNLGTALFALDEPDEARPHLERAVELDPRNIDARHNLAALLVEQRKWTEAEGILLAALEISPDDARLLRRLEQVQGELGVRTATPAPTPPPVVKPPEAVVTEPVAASPGGPCSKPLSAGARSRLAQQMFTDGREAYGRGDMVATEAILERALECEPESAPILNHLGAARLQAGNPAGAASAFALALQFQPDFREASVNLALSLLAQGRCEDSTSRLGGLRAQHPDFGEAAYQHARALLRCGRPSEALSAIEAAERLLPQDPRVAKLKERLSQQELQ